MRRKRRTIRREHDLERQLIGMVYERMIELSGPDHYRINYFGDPQEDRRRRQQAELEASHVRSLINSVRLRMPHSYAI